MNRKPFRFPGRGPVRFPHGGSPSGCPSRRGLLMSAPAALLTTALASPLTGRAAGAAAPSAAASGTAVAGAATGRSWRGCGGPTSLADCYDLLIHLPGVSAARLL
jgi:hypothetical protein